MQRVKPKIRNFEDCASAGYPVEESYPEVCKVPNGGSFVNEAQRAKAEAPALEAGTNLTFTTLVSGDNKGQTKAGRVVITDRATWVKYWNDVHAHILPLPPLIEVDFAHDMVVAIEMGQKMTGGYSIKVSDIIEKPSGITVKIQESEPGKDCSSTQSVTNPYHIVRLVKSAKTIQFSSEVSFKDCKP